MRFHSEWELALPSQCLKVMGHSQFLGAAEGPVCAVIQERNLVSVSRAALSHPRHDDEVLMVRVASLAASRLA